MRLNFKYSRKFDQQQREPRCLIVCFLRKVKTFCPQRVVLINQNFVIKIIKNLWV